MGRVGRGALWRVGPILVVGVALLAGCTETPAPPLVPTPTTRTTLPTDVSTTQAVIGVDSVAGGYNPHALADQSAITTALSDLMLPSVFRTAPDGTPVLDRTVMNSAEVTSADPFTVTYSVRTDASWSDGTPVDATDFVYLRSAMTSQPGVVDPAGYDLISDIRARDNAKVIEVTFRKPYPGWRSLFNDLLPGHLLKDAPGGWASAFADGFPASAGPFDIKSLDSGAGEIVLERNDRYWGKPSVLDQLILRKSDEKDIVDTLRSGDDQVALTRPDADGLKLLQGLGATVSLTDVPRPEIATVLLRPASAVLADPAVRGAVAAAIDRAALITVGTGGAPELPANALVLPPSRPGYVPTVPAGPPAVPDPAKVTTLLTQAGYQKPATGLWTKDNHPLSLTIAAPAGRSSYEDMARTLQQQLSAAGIKSTVITPNPDQLYGQLLAPQATAGANNGQAAGVPDIVVGPRPTGGDPATELASWFGCAPTLPGGSAPAPGGPLGLCDQAVQPTIDSALTGEMSLSDALAKVEPLLWADNVDIPLFQLTDQLAIGHLVSGVTAGPPFSGPFSGAASWARKAT